MIMKEDDKKSSTPETTIIIKNSQTPGNKPGTENLEPGELGLTLCKGEEDIWTKNTLGEIINLRSPRHDLVWGDLFFKFKTEKDYIKEKNTIPSTSIAYIENPGIIIIDGVYFTNYNSLQNKVDKIDGKQLSTEDFTTQYKNNVDKNTSDISTIKINKVDKIPGKQLSTEDFTTILKDKLLGLENYNDTNVKDNLSNILSRLSNIESKNTEQDNNISLKVDKIPGKQLSTEDFTTQYKNNVDKNTSDISTIKINKVDKIDGKQLSTEDFTTTEKQKLASLENYNDTEIRELLSTIESKNIEQDNNINLKVDKISGKQLSTEDFTTILKNKLLGLENYNDTEIRKLLSTIESKNIEQDNNINLKVDKIPSKQLSTEDFTTTEKQKLASLENYNDTEIRELLSTIESKNTEQDNNISLKVDKIPGKQLSTEDFTTIEKNQLGNIVSEIPSIKNEINNIKSEIGSLSQDLTNILEN